MGRASKGSCDAVVMQAVPQVGDAGAALSTHPTQVGLDFHPYARQLMAYGQLVDVWPPAGNSKGFFLSFFGSHKRKNGSLASGAKEKRCTRMALFT